MEEGGWVWGKGRKCGRGFLAGMNSEFLVCPRFFTSTSCSARGKSFSEVGERDASFVDRSPVAAAFTAVARPGRRESWGRS